MQMRNTTVLGLLLMMLTVGYVEAAQQSPVYTDNIGRTHFLGRGGYSSMTEMQNQESQTDSINSLDFSINSEATTRKREFQESKKTRSDVPISNYKPYSYDRNNVYVDDTTSPGVNASQSFFTDELGRIHFFGKDSKVKK